MAASTLRSQQARYDPVPDDSDLSFEKDGREERVEELLSSHRQSRVPYKSLFFALLTIYLVSGVFTLLSLRTENHPLISSQKLFGHSTSVLDSTLELTTTVKRIAVTFNADHRFDANPDAENSPWNDLVPGRIRIRPDPDLTFAVGTGHVAIESPSKWNLSGGVPLDRSFWPAG
jgi:hypothetical protein